MRYFSVIIARICHCEVKPKQSLFPFKNITGRVWVIIIALFLFFPSLGFAETKEIISEGTYNMGDGETPSVAESRALLQAKRTALEQAGTYVESYTKVKNLQLTEDEIKVLSSGIMEVEFLDKKRTVVGDVIHFWVQIKAKVNPDKIEEMAKRVKERAVVEDYKNIQEAYDKSQKDIEELKKQLAQAKGEKEKKQVEAKITDEERLFQANEWFEKGNKHNLDFTWTEVEKLPEYQSLSDSDKTKAKVLYYKEYDDAIEAYTSAIALDPNYAAAYNNRGVAYKNKGQNDRAIEDYNKAIALDPNYAAAYNNRGNAYANKGQYDRAIEDYNKAIALDPNYAKAYNNRGGAYDNKGQNDRAIEDYNKAIALDPNNAAAYNNRGAVYAKNSLIKALLDKNKNPRIADVYKNNADEDYDRAIEDYNKAIALDPNYALAYARRGSAYDNKGQYDRAIEDYNKAIALDPNYAAAYNNRGLAYYKKGNMGRAISDFQKACDMGDVLGCEYLQIVLENR